ncbi:MAG: Crp/Fnr family transcriptional regulator [Bacteroidota bacterium]
MKGLERLFENMERFVFLKDHEKDRIASIFGEQRIKRRQFLDQPGFVCTYRNYVVRGAFRSYYLDGEGKEHTVQIAMDDWFVSDFYSYITQTPATLFVEALEDSTILRTTYDTIEPLCKEIHALSEYFRITTERAFAYSRNRALSNLSLNAEERFLELHERYPEMVQRVPQKVIASYLGMTPEFLSKIRKKISAKT